MVGNQGPGKTLRLGFIDQSTQTANEFITIIIVKKILRRSIPLAMMWCTASGASILARLGIHNG
jgi:hypothetical protein